MRICLRTSVEQDFRQVYRQFDEQLFIRLKPPLVSLKLIRFDGSNKGDEIHLEISFILFRQMWISKITEDVENESECYFIDESKDKQLPFFLKKWRHKHLITKSEKGGTIIEDRIEYKAPLGLNYILYPILWLQFAWRRPIYRRLFRKVEGYD